ncbi:hypothetical protein NMG60_11001961 [Bertholletia excelsa]
MKKLIRRLSRVADSSDYCPLRSKQPSAPSCFSSFRSGKFRRSGTVPQGGVPVYVGEEMVRFVVSAEMLNHPVFVKLLEKSAQEYGYKQSGGLRIPCSVLVFERVLEGLRLGDDSVYDLIGNSNGFSRLWNPFLYLFFLVQSRFVCLNTTFRYCIHTLRSTRSLYSCIYTLRSMSICRSKVGFP